MKPKKKQAENPDAQTNQVYKQQAESAKEQTKPISSPATCKSNPVTVAKYRVPQTLRRRVSFSETLIRGPGGSYTPPAQQKAVRFAPALVRGEGSEYSDHSPTTFEVYSPDRSTAKTPGETEDTSGQSRENTSGSRLGRSASRQNSQNTNMGTRHRSEMRDKRMDVESALNSDSDSDESFTDVVIPALQVKESAPQRRSASSGYLPYSSNMLAVKPVPGLMRVKFSGGHTTVQSDVEDDESYIAAVTTENTKRNSLPEGPTNLSSVSGRVLYGHGSRTSPVGSSNLAVSIRRSWPQPIFVWRGNRAPNFSGRPSPTFALRDSPDPSKHVTAMSTKQ